MILSDVTTSDRPRLLPNKLIQQRVAQPFIYREVALYTTVSFANLTQPNVRDIVDVSEENASEDAELVKLGPVQRWIYMAKNDRVAFIIAIASFIASLYAISFPFLSFGFSLFLNISPEAHAQGNHSTTPVVQSTSWIQIFMATMVATFGLWSLLTISFAKTANNVTYAKDIGKIVLGFVVGFFGSGRGR